jgi:uncharacterized membrane protein YgaE (UPF0421/DUF939 family)
LPIITFGYYRLSIGLMLVIFAALLMLLEMRLVVVTVVRRN